MLFLYSLQRYPWDTECHDAAFRPREKRTKISHARGESAGYKLQAARRFCSVRLRPQLKDSPPNASYMHDRGTHAATNFTRYLERYYRLP